MLRRCVVDVVVEGNTRAGVLADCVVVYCLVAGWADASSLFRLVTLLGTGNVGDSWDAALRRCVVVDWA